MMKNQDPYNEGRLLDILNRMGEGLLAGFMFIIGCVPVITLGTSLAALYYSMTKSVRRGRGYPAKEFIRSYKKNLAGGIAYTLCSAAIAVILLFSRSLWVESESAESFLFTVIMDGIIAVFAVVLIWLFPLISRFELSFFEGVKKAAFMSFRHLFWSLLLLFGTAVCILVIIRIPIAGIIFLPPVWCYLSTYIIEPVFSLYIDKPGDDTDDWYYDPAQKNQ